MKAMKRQQLTQMLEDWTKFRIPDEARAAHLNAISEAIESAPVVVPVVRSRWSTQLRRRITGLLVVTMTLGPAGVAFAAQGSLPGDSLYPAKRVVERVQAVFDPSVPARHRLDEVSGLIARGDDSSEVARALQEAAAAVAAAPDGDALSGALEALQQEIEPSPAEPVDEKAVGPAGSSVEPSEESANEPPEASDAEQVEPSEESANEPPEASDTEQVEGSDAVESGSSSSVSDPEEDETTVSEPTEPEESGDVGSGESADDEAPDAGGSGDSDEPEHPDSET
ncbi:hypothetical protein BMS3Abin02_01202 [bacterium BMS3Abin02]|nr:hypothetical protein BMS3Abin02_01202 [bacterium BMS3Abin02]HDL48519.1 hypothetical protein [Actinomycetota bacterium]